MLCFIKMQQGNHISSHAWIMYDLQCYFLGYLITSIFQNVYISFSSLRTNMHLYKNITYLWTLRIIFLQIPMHTSNWHGRTTFVHFSKKKVLEKEIQNNYFSLWHLCLFQINFPSFKINHTDTYTHTYSSNQSGATIYFSNVNEKSNRNRTS